MFLEDIFDKFFGRFGSYSGKCTLSIMIFAIVAKNRLRCPSSTLKLWVNYQWLRTLDAHIDLFADNLALRVQDVELERATAKIQKALYKVEEWCDLEKSEVTVLSSDSHEAKYWPHLTILGEPLQFNPTHSLEWRLTEPWASKPTPTTPQRRWRK